MLLYEAENFLVTFTWNPFMYGWHSHHDNREGQEGHSEVQKCMQVLELPAM